MTGFADLLNCASGHKLPQRAPCHAADFTRTVCLQACGAPQSGTTCAQSTCALTEVQRRMRKMHRTKICYVQHVKSCANIRLFGRILMVMYKPERDFLRVRCQSPLSSTHADAHCFVMCRDSALHLSSASSPPLLDAALLFGFKWPVRAIPAHIPTHITRWL